MKFEFSKLIGDLSDDERLRFYEILAHNLTVSVRGIWSDDQLSDHERVEHMKWVNEIMHRVVMKSAKLRMKQDDYSEGDFWEGIKHWVAHPQTLVAPLSGPLKQVIQVVARDAPSNKRLERTRR